MRTESVTNSKEKGTEPTKNRGEKEVNARQDRRVGTACTVRITSNEADTAIATPRLRYMYQPPHHHPNWNCSTSPAAVVILLHRIPPQIPSILYSPHNTFAISDYPKPPKPVTQLLTVHEMLFTYTSPNPT
jgi:hypothetical protein